MTRRSKTTLGLGAGLFGLWLLHVVWFSWFGPPAWFYAVVERSPETRRAQLDSSFDAYLVGDADREPWTVGGPSLPEIPERLGRARRGDVLPGAGLAVVATVDDTGPRGFMRSAADPSWRELRLPGETPIVELALAESPRGPVVLAVSSSPWWPYERHYVRFWSALFRSALRPAFGVWRIDPATGEVSFAFAGHALAPAPNRRLVAFVRSQGTRGFHSLHVWDAATGAVADLASLWEFDPGSGISFGWRWSDDSRVVLISGEHAGHVASRPARSDGWQQLLYDVPGDRLVALD